MSLTPVAPLIRSFPPDSSVTLADLTVHLARSDGSIHRNHWRSNLEEFEGGGDSGSCLNSEILREHGHLTFRFADVESLKPLDR
jgi:hypothetical protein